MTLYIYKISALLEWIFMKSNTGGTY